MLLLGLDLETTGRNTNTDQIIEVGAVIWDTDKCSPVQILSEMVWYDGIWDGASSTKEEIEKLTNISYEDIVTYGSHPTEVLNKLKKVMSIKNLVAVVAHNGNEFDKPMLLSNAKKWNIELPDLHWIDTMVDIPYDANIQTRKLPHLAAEHGFINPFSHRAIFDVLTMLKITQSYDMDWVIKLSKEPSITLIANTTPPWQDGGKSNDEAKSKGFRWNGKAWVKTVRESQLQTEKESFSAGVREIR